MYLGYVKTDMALRVVLEMDEGIGDLCVVQKSELVLAHLRPAAGTRIITDRIIITHAILVQDLVYHLAAAAAEVLIMRMKHFLMAVFATMITPGCGRRSSEFTHVYSAGWVLLLIEGYNRLCSI